MSPDHPDRSPASRAAIPTRSRRSQARLIQLWLAALVVSAAAAVLQLHLWPTEPRAVLPRLDALPGQPLPSWAGHQERARATSPILRRRLEQQLELRLAALVDQATQPFQVALHSRPLAPLHLQRRRLLQRPTGEVAVGVLQRQPAAQTCLSGSGHAISASALERLQVVAPADARSRLLRLLGWQPFPPRQCLLVTLVARQPAEAWRASDQEQLIQRLEVIVAILSANRAADNPNSPNPNSHSQNANKSGRRQPQPQTGHSGPA